MRHIIGQLIVSAALISPVLGQNPQTQPPNQQNTEAPCNPTTQSQSPNDAAKVANRVHFNPFAVKGGIWGKAVKDITDKTGVSVSAPPPTKIEKPVPPKPCPLAVTPSNGVSAPAAKTIPAPEPKTMFVCPPNTAPVPGYPFCLKPDNTLVDAIKITAPSPSKPVPPVPAVPALAQH